MTGDREIQRMRRKIADVDREIVEAVARRMGLSARMGELKAMQGIAIEAKDVEAAVLERATELGVELGLEEELVKELFDLLIAHSKREQRRHRGVGEDRNAGA
jgi:chorismate mutase